MKNGSCSFVLPKNSKEALSSGFDISREKKRQNRKLQLYTNGGGWQRDYSPQTTWPNLTPIAWQWTKRVLGNKRPVTWAVDLQRFPFHLRLWSVPSRATGRKEQIRNCLKTESDPWSHRLENEAQFSPQSRSWTEQALISWLDVERQCTQSLFVRFHAQSSSHSRNKQILLG